jgi:hypothetical protein
VTPASMTAAKNAVEAALRLYANASVGVAAAAVSGATTKGKVYEAHVLSLLAERLHADEKCVLTLHGGDTIRLPSAPGLIDRARYAYLTVQHPSGRRWELWTDLEIVGLSAELGLRPPTRAHASELDLVLVDADTHGRPYPHQVHLGIECKHRPFEKAFLRGALGIRRQISLLQPPTQTAFDVWPAAAVPAHPPSCLIVYGTDAGVVNYRDAGDPFGVHLEHQPV